MQERLALLRNVALVAMASYVEAAVGLLVGVLIARTLGPTEYGHYAFGIWLCGVLIMAGNNALPSSSIKFLAEARGAGQPQVQGALLWRFLRWQTISSTLAVAGFAAWMIWRPLSDWRDDLPLMLAIAGVAIWSRAGFWMRGAVGKGYEQFLAENVSLALTALLNLVLVCVLAWQSAGVAAFFAAYAALGVVANLLVRFMLRRLEVRPLPGPIPAELAAKLRKHLLHTGVLMLLVAVANRAVEMTLLKQYAGPEAVGFFAIAGALTKGAVDILAGGMASVLLPAMSRRFGEGGIAALGGILAESTRLYWFAGMAIAGLGLTVADGIVHLLYGARYDGAIPALRWHLVIAGLAVVSGAAAAVLTASDRQLDRIRVIVVGLVFNLAAGLWLIPRFGLNGAIGSLALTALIDTVLIWWYACRRAQVRLPIGPMARLLFAAGVATALGYATAHVVPMKLAFIAGGALFVVSYLALSVVLKTWRQGDFEVIANVAGRLGRFGPGASARVLRLRRFAMADAV